jgi:hypothetical protein
MLVTLFALALVQGPESAAKQPPIYEAAFRPLRRSERMYAPLGPVGPYYPQVAVDRRKSGDAVLSCQVGESGTLKKCKPVSDNPVNLNFALAARAMANQNRIFVADQALVEGETILVRVPFVLGAPVTVEP